VPRIPRKREICKEKDPEIAAKWLVEKLTEEKLLR